MLKQRFIFLIFSICILSGISLAQSYYDYKLSSINFSGNNTFSSSELQSIIESKVSPMWFWVFLHSFTPLGDAEVYFDSSNISVDLIALKEFYRANGYFLTKISYRIQADTSNKAVNLFYDIKENKPFYYKKISLLGLNDLSEYDQGRMQDELVKLDSTKRYSESEIQQNINAIRKFLSNNGYVAAQYDSTVIAIDTLNYRVNVSITFNIGNRFTISDIIVKKTGTSIEQITNQLIDEIVGIKQGSVFDQSAIDRSELRLLKTELFTSVYINTLIKDTTENKIPLEVNATIGSLNGLSPEIKADNEFNSFNTGLGISYIRKNFLGDARKLTLSTSFRFIDVLNFNFKNLFKAGVKNDSTFQGVLDFNLRMEQPYFLGKPILTTTELYYRSQTFIGQMIKSYGGSQKFDFEMPFYTFVTLLRPNITYDVSKQQVDYGDTSNISITSLTPGIGLELGSSKTNDLQFPSTGYMLFLTPEIFQSKTTISVINNIANQQNSLIDSSIEGSTYFYRIQLGGTNYIPLNYSKTLVFASKIRGGYIQSFYRSDNNLIPVKELIPPNKTFYAGGSNSVRGWRARELVPRDTVQYIGFTTESNYIRGGTVWIEGSFELRNKFNEYLGAVLFADYGNTWNSWKDVVWKDFAVSVGWGFRLYTPIAPFRLDFGTKFYNPFNEKTIFEVNFLKNVEIHFGIGEAF